MDVHYITSSTLGRLKLKLSTPGKQSVDDSQWLRVGLPSESGAYSDDFIVILWPLGEQPGDTLLLNLQRSTCQTQDSLGCGRALDMDQYRPSRLTILLRAGYRVPAS